MHLITWAGVRCWWVCGNWKWWGHGNVSVAAIIIDSIIIIGSVQTNKAAAVAAKYATRLPKTVKVLQKGCGKGLLKWEGVQRGCLLSLQQINKRNSEELWLNSLCPFPSLFPFLIISFTSSWPSSWTNFPCGFPLHKFKCHNLPSLNCVLNTCNRLGRYFKLQYFL